MRYADDKLASERHMGVLKDAFGDHLETVEFDGNDHSLLTLDFHQPAYQRVQDYFRALCPGRIAYNPSPSLTHSLLQALTRIC
ncbi:hypothetical protein [Ruegeria atlantica]|nr:hypothetical protein [Ruegeria atlantica]